MISAPSVGHSSDGTHRHHYLTIDVAHDWWLWPPRYIGISTLPNIEVLK